MKTSVEIYDILKNNFADSIINFIPDPPKGPIIEVNPYEINKVCYFLQNDKEMLFDHLDCLSGVDDANGEKVNLPDGGFEIKGGTLSVYYHLESYSFLHKVVLKVSTPRENPEVVSVTDLWNSANWHEREAYDLIGIKFLNHPDLIRILMPYDWEFGHPLRKDYKNPEFYQGIKVPY
ncbi:MAG: NADH-quinone oxidoreductase subunit C [Ignavibacterium sp.]